MLPKATWLELVVAVLPLLPLIITLFAVASNRRMPIILAGIFAVLVLVSGTVLTFILMAFSGGGTEMVTLHGAALTLACATSIMLISKVQNRTMSIVFGIFSLPMLVGVWSLAMVPIAYSSAIKISSNRGFCIGDHSPTNRELASIAGLRGLSFYTTRSGYKIGDTWYFHGLLLVEDDGATSVYNWSPRNMEFQEVERPLSLIASPFTACEPRISFLQELHID
ncbi:MAG: hypothetical protein ACJA06_001502 [Halocynthiibacter sp.]